MYSLRYTSSAVKALKKAPVDVAQKVRAALELVAVNPLQSMQVQKLSGREGYRWRVGNWRVLYMLENDVLVILVLDIGDRKEVYR